MRQAACTSRIQVVLTKSVCMQLTFLFSPTPQGVSFSIIGAQNHAWCSSPQLYRAAVLCRA